MSATPLLPGVNSPTNKKLDTASGELTLSLLGASLAELTAWVQQKGQPAYRGKQLHEWIYHKGVRSLADISVFPKQWRAEVAEISIGRSTIHYRSVAPDGTVKYLLQLADGYIIETVGIPTYRSRGEGETQRRGEVEKFPDPKSLERLTVCVSTQVGCPMGCDFCATGKGGYKRNLARHEIIDQVLTVQEDFQQRVSHIVFMGMGEPLLNSDHVLGAIKSLNQDVGIGQRCMTVSTVGISDHIRKFAQHKLQVTLAVSLHAPNQALREKLIPSARAYQIEDLLAECREYVEITGRRVTFEYVLLADVNDFPEDAVELAQRLRRFQSHVNLIPYNPISEVDYKRPTPSRIQTFVKVLKQHHIAVSVRYSRGLEADAACGQLRASKQ
ncbi:23S rRNA (adenine(2503)-C(2))-methyltransferase RlmN [Chlorogloeopsis sp. ULAP01]|uniref:23S rRNA (adenine(2503)-C(2))-methyltransferase RlmN n=1 Tax=Chlorogloeopsis sp. ULAP01 TaxID=3056483 RepID=UPI0025AB42B1|nr:23S rRNA (adenine(2503)-C(2))-methyltransferase RlmN [Chlorogloeopsis sp. ULAP01]MDM9381236.1 23S rRNA (adenine(2503)-C(2))-methyltransferase RlmN [Chlorogloeopsis sp. ULAP01]